ncbi:MAG: hypothetical protein QOD06_3351 [Candidatus Binatota bacterium]|nr:hypothetical protein [Candidatus Binatota bacterium]
MLSRVAESVYWMARHIERAENTARLIDAHADLLLDLPRTVAPGWKSLVAILGSEALLAIRNQEPDERSVVKLLVDDPENSGSILSCLALARENARSVRDILPREAWEQINHVTLTARAGVAAGLTKKGRHEFLHRIVVGSHQVTGLIAGAMSHDHGYDFLRLGRHLERADMTTRIIDIRSASLPASTTLAPFESTQWMSVLRSLSAYQMYRRHMQGRVTRSHVLVFLFQDRLFPRSFRHCLLRAEECLRNLPRSDPPLRVCARILRSLESADPGNLDQQALQRLIDDFQLALGDLHQQIAASYFGGPAVPPARQSQSQSMASDGPRQLGRATKSVQRT